MCFRVFSHSCISKDLLFFSAHILVSASHAMLMFSFHYVLALESCTSIYKRLGTNVTFLLGFSYLIASMGLQVLWSFGLACLDLHALRSKRSLYNPVLVSLFVVGDWVSCYSIVCTHRRKKKCTFFFFFPSSSMSTIVFIISVVLYSSSFSFYLFLHI